MRISGLCGSSERVLRPGRGIALTWLRYLATGARTPPRFGPLAHPIPFTSHSRDLYPFRERGFGTNPWSTHSRFLVSHRLLADSTYADPMRAWLGAKRAGSLLVLDEAHHAAPSHRGRYGIESKFTRAVRDLCDRFEHRLFLSATPHNGHSNSFSTLLELLDPHRFTRGVKVRGKKDLEAAMVRRLKEDIREEVGGFPIRRVLPVVIDGLPDDAPELVLSRLLDEYRTLRSRRFANATARGRAAAGLLVVGLQQRLLSSIEAFARSLKRHRKTVERQWAEGGGAATGATKPGESRSVRANGTDLDGAGFLRTAEADDDSPDHLGPGPDPDEDRDLAADAEAAEEAEEELLIEAANREAEAGLRRDATAEEIWREELRLLDRMQAVADEARTRPDAKMNRLIDWIRFVRTPSARRCRARSESSRPLRRERDESGREVWRFPELGGRVAADPSWAATLDTLRVPIKSASRRVVGERAGFAAE